eukprot:Gb_13378 [translate_table: standard]
MGAHRANDLARRPSCGTMTRKKWLGFVTAIWVQTIAGNNYTFSNYSVALKAILNVNQLQLNNLSVAKDVGKAFGLVAGFASDYLPAWLILLIGALEGAVGYGVQWLVVSQKIRPLPYWQMCLFLCMGGNSTTWMNTAVLVTCLRNFPRNRGPVVGILKGYIGLSTAIFTDLCTALFSSNPSSFLLMLTLVPGIVCVASMIFLHPAPPAPDDAEENEENKNFFIFNVIAIVVAVYLLSFDMTGEHGVVLSRVFAGILLLLMAAPLIVPLKLWMQESKSSSGQRLVPPCFFIWKSKSGHEDEGEHDMEKQAKEPLLKSVQEGQSSTSDADNPGISIAKDAVEPVEEPKSGNEGAIGRKPRIGEDHTILQAVQKFDFWLLFFAFLCGVGTGMAVINNMGQIGLAMGYVDVSIFVSLISIWGFFGRIGAGSISEHFIRKWGVPRPVWMAASQGLMIGGYILMAIGMPGSLYIGSIIVGICYGVRLSISVPTASELFGLKYYGMIYNFLILNLPIGSFLFSGLLAGILYDIEASKGQKLNIRAPKPGWMSVVLSGKYFGVDSNESNTCVGAHCYRLVFLVMAGVCVLGLGLDVLLTFRMKKLYVSIHKSKKAVTKSQSQKLLHKKRMN